MSHDLLWEIQNRQTRFNRGAVRGANKKSFQFRQLDLNEVEWTVLPRHGIAFKSRDELVGRKRYRSQE